MITKVKEKPFARLHCDEAKMQLSWRLTIPVPYSWPGPGYAPRVTLRASKRGPVRLSLSPGQRGTPIQSFSWHRVSRHSEEKISADLPWLGPHRSLSRLWPFPGNYSNRRNVLAPHVWLLWRFKCAQIDKSVTIIWQIRGKVAGGAPQIKWLRFFPFTALRNISCIARKSYKRNIWNRSGYCLCPHWAPGRARLQCNHFLQTKVRVLIPGWAGPHQARRDTDYTRDKQKICSVFSDLCRPGVYLLNLPGW